MLAIYRHIIDMERHKVTINLFYRFLEVSETHATTDISGTFGMLLQSML